MGMGFFTSTGRIERRCALCALVFIGVVGLVDGGSSVSRRNGVLDDTLLVMEDFYLETIATLTGTQKMKELSRRELKWLLSRLQDDDEQTRASAVREFLCTKRAMKSFCEDMNNGIQPGWANRQEGPPLRVATKPCEPFTFCEPDENVQYAPDDPKGPTGYSIDLWKAVASALNITNYEYTCLSTTGYMLEQLTADKYDVATACISVLASRLKDMEFSRVYYYSGLEVMIMRPGDVKKDPLSMLQPFTWDVWLCVLLSIVTVGVFTWVFERHHNNHMKVQAWPGLLLGQWHSWTTFLQNPFINYRSWPARLTALSFLIVSLVIVATYTANLAAFLTRASLQVTILSKNDLAGKRVGTSAEETTSFNWVQAQGQSVVVPFKENEERFLALKEKKIDAIVWDSPPLRYRAFQDCDKVVVGDVFNLEDYAIAIHKDKTDLAAQIDSAVVKLKEERYNDELYAVWFQGGTNCEATLDQNVESSETDAVSLETTWVLFAFLLASLMVASFIALEPKIAALLKGRVEPANHSEDSDRSVTFAEQIKGIGRSNAELVGAVPQE